MNYLVDNALQLENFNQVPIVLQGEDFTQLQEMPFEDLQLQYLAAAAQPMIVQAVPAAPGVPVPGALPGAPA